MRTSDANVTPKIAVVFYATYLQGRLIRPRNKRRPTQDAVEILHRRYYEVKPERLTGLETARVNDQVARKIAALRTHPGLSQRQLARLVGTTASVICRLEDAEYEGHSLLMLDRIAAAGTMPNAGLESRLRPSFRSRPWGLFWRSLGRTSPLITRQSQHA